MSETNGLPEPGPRGTILGTGVTACRFEDALRWLDRAVDRGETGYVCPANVYTVMLGFDDPAYRERVAGAAWVMADGMPLVWALRRLGYAAERVHGDDLCLAFCARRPQVGHFFLGGAPGQPETVVAELTRRVPQVRVVGCRATPRRPVPEAESTEMVRQIRDAGAEMVWVGMGTPHQDLWMARHAEAVGVPLAGVGSVFDLLAGRSRPAPEWIKAAGLQWLFRLLQEPRRLGPRYLRHNPRFLWHFGRQLLRPGKS